jgi:tyrosine-protein kinase Etk/Wzc
MSEMSQFVPLTQQKLSASEDGFDLKKIIHLVLGHKYLFVTAIVIALVLAFFFNTYTIPIYRVSASILIEEDKNSNASGNDQLLEGFGLMPGVKNFDNQIMVLTSRSLVNQALEELPFDTTFYFKRFISRKSFYPLKPIKIIAIHGSQLPEDIDYSLKYLGKDKFMIEGKSDLPFLIRKVASFGDNIDIPGGTFMIVRNESDWRKEDEHRKIFFRFYSRRKLVGNYIDRLKISPVSKKGTIVEVNLEGTNKIEDLAFLSKLTDVFINSSLEKKNNEALRTISFIDDQLSGISDSLLTNESKLQRFRTRNRVMNISSQGQAIIDQAMKLENDRARLDMEAKYYDYLSEYLLKETVGEVPVAPSTMGIVDPGLTRLVEELTDLQGKLYSKGMGDKNPLQSQMISRVQSIKTALNEMLKSMKGANDLAIKESQSQINAINARASALPVTERQLLGIERRYKLNDELYTFLLEKRAIAQMQKASNTADNEVIDYPEYSNKPVKPKSSLIYLFAIFAGAGLPALWIYLTDQFNLKIKEITDISRITDTPVSGHIPHSRIDNHLVVIEDPESPMAEAFRLLRSRMAFFIKDINKPVILITSSMANEGKTTVAINLALAYSILGKKTILIGYDLRNPGIFDDFDFDNEYGVSTWLIGHDSIDKIIRKTNNENLDIILSGPIPPNPAELTTLDRTDTLIKLLKERYDYIIIDSSPVGIVSDTFHLFALSDVCVMVVRPNFTFKELFSDCVRDLRNINVNNLSLVINDIIPNGRSYGYGYRYGYGEKNVRKRMFWLWSKARSN